MFNLAEYRNKPQRLADFLPWAALVAPGVVLNKDGSLQRTARFRGPDLESATPAELVGVAGRLNDALRRLRNVPGIATMQLSGEDIVRHPLVRRIVAAYDEPQFPRSGGGPGARRMETSPIVETHSAPEANPAAAPPAASGDPVAEQN